MLTITSPSESFGVFWHVVKFSNLLTYYPSADSCVSEFDAMFLRMKELYHSHALLSPPTSLVQDVFNDTPSLTFVHVLCLHFPDFQPIFKTLPGLPVSRLELGGKPGQQRDKIFAAGGTVVRAFTKKGKQFLDFSTEITEQIKNM